MIIYAIPTDLYHLFKSVNVCCLVVVF